MEEVVTQLSFLLEVVERRWPRCRWILLLLLLLLLLLSFQYSNNVLLSLQVPAVLLLQWSSPLHLLTIWKKINLNKN